jgi:hypothetical protein
MGGMGGKKRKTDLGLMGSDIGVLRGEILGRLGPSDHVIQTGIYVQLDFEIYTNFYTD